MSRHPLWNWQARQASHRWINSVSSHFAGASLASSRTAPNCTSCTWKIWMTLTRRMLTLALTLHLYRTLSPVALTLNSNPQTLTYNPYPNPKTSNPTAKTSAQSCDPTLSQKLSPPPQQLTHICLNVSYFSSVVGPSSGEHWEDIAKEHGFMTSSDDDHEHGTIGVRAAQWIACHNQTSITYNALFLCVCVCAKYIYLYLYNIYIYIMKHPLLSSVRSFSYHTIVSTS